MIRFFRRNIFDGIENSLYSSTEAFSWQRSKSNWIMCVYPSNIISLGIENWVHGNRERMWGEMKFGPFSRMQNFPRRFGWFEKGEEKRGTGGHEEIILKGKFLYGMCEGENLIVIHDHSILFLYFPHRSYGHLCKITYRTEIFNTT